MNTRWTIIRTEERKDHMTATRSVAGLAAIVFFVLGAPLTAAAGDFTPESASTSLPVAGRSTDSIEAIAAAEESAQDGAEALEDGEYVGPASDLPRLKEAMARQSDLLTVPAPCGTRLDWYRVIDWSGNTYCFSNAGNRFVHIYNVRSLCPGNNTGRVMYQADNTMYNSVWRSGHSNWSQCYHFTFGPTVHKIEIR